MKSNRTLAAGVCIAVVVIMVLELGRERRHAREPQEGAETTDRATVKAPPVQPHAVAQAQRDGAEGAAVAMEGAGTTAEAVITRADGSTVRARSWDGEFARVAVEPREALSIRLALREVDSHEPVRIEADNGGSLNRRLGPLVLRPAKADGSMEFQYAVGPHPGKYTLLVTQGGRQEVLDFHVGPEQPIGRPGPVRHFSGDRS